MNKKVDYKPLQNGSDIRGIAMEGDDGKKVNLGREEARRLTEAFVKWVCCRTGKVSSELIISVGHDSRLTAEPLKEAALESLTRMGVKALDCGLASTPAMFMSTVFEEFNCDGAIMITASHLPYNRNGFKYFTRYGGLDKEDISEIIKEAEKSATSGEAAPCGEPSGIKASLMNTYAAYLRDKIIREVDSKTDFDRPLTGLRIVVDAGNGAGGFYAKDVLEPLGADLTGSQFLNADGRFPNHAPNPEDKEAMASLCRAVVDNHADLGLIFDTDVDRSSAVGSSGREINRNAIVALAAALIAREHPGTTVVTDSITSDQLTVYIEECLGLKHLRYKRGYRNVINKAVSLNEAGTDSQLAIETSGHAAYKENYFLDDGAYLATKIVIKAAQLKAADADIEVILSSLDEPKEAREYRFSVNKEDFSGWADGALKALREWICRSGGNMGATLAEPNYEGVRINFDNEQVKGWCLLRKSLHDPKMPLNIEVTRGGCDIILDIIAAFLKEYGGISL